MPLPEVKESGIKRRVPYSERETPSSYYGASPDPWSLTPDL